MAAACCRQAAQYSIKSVWWWINRKGLEKILLSPLCVSIYSFVLNSELIDTYRLSTVVRVRRDNILESAEVALWKYRLGTGFGWHSSHSRGWDLFAPLATTGTQNYSLSLFFPNRNSGDFTISLLYGYIVNWLIPVTVT